MSKLFSEENKAIAQIGLVKVMSLCFLFSSGQLAVYFFDLHVAKRYQELMAIYAVAELCFAGSLLLGLWSFKRFAALSLFYFVCMSAVGLAAMSLMGALSMLKISFFFSILALKIGAILAFVKNKKVISAVWDPLGPALLLLVLILIPSLFTTLVCSLCLLLVLCIVIPQSESFTIRFLRRVELTQVIRTWAQLSYGRLFVWGGSVFAEDAEDVFLLFVATRICTVFMFFPNAVNFLKLKERFSLRVEDYFSEAKLNFIVMAILFLILGIFFYVENEILHANIEAFRFLSFDLIAVAFSFSLTAVLAQPLVVKSTLTESRLVFFQLFLALSVGCYFLARNVYFGEISVFDYLLVFFIANCINLIVRYYYLLRERRNDFETSGP